jgi:hypothetical protein
MFENWKLLGRTRVIKYLRYNTNVKNENTTEEENSSSQTMILMLNERCTREKNCPLRTRSCCSRKKKKIVYDLVQRRVRRCKIVTYR